MKQHQQVKNIIFYNTKTQHENLGDLIIAKILLDKLRNYGTLIVNEEEVPESFFQELDIKDNEMSSEYKIKFKNLLLWTALKSLLIINKRVYYVLTPGHIYGGSSFYYLIKVIPYLFLLKILGVRICRFGASVGPFSPKGKIAEQLRAKFMYFYSVRDEKSKAYANSIGINKVKMFPDMAWLMDISNEGHTSLNLPSEYVLFSFRESTHGLDDPELYKKNLFPVLDEIVDIVCRVWQKKLVVSYQVEFDFNFCKYISSRYKDKYEVIFIEEKLDSNTICEIYKSAFIVFSNRLHVLMFAMVCGSLPIAVIDKFKHDKITGIFSDAGLMQLVIDILNGEPKYELLNEILTNAPLIKKEITSCIESKRKLSDAIFKQVMN